MKKFEVGKTYAVTYRVDRYFFEVVSRTPKTAVMNLRGVQPNASQFDPPRVVVAGNYTQKISIRVDKVTGVEYGYVKLSYDLYGRMEVARAAVMANEVVALN